MIVKNAKYEITAVYAEQYPVNNIPEVAFVGRSNVGKSSVINSLTNRRNLARTGSTPGKTKQINFYNIDDKLYFVDLPGYGYASVSKEQQKSWGDLADTYLFTRTQLKLIALLVDIRHTPTNDDKMMCKWLKDHNIPNFVVATKTDKIPRAQLKARLQDISNTLEVTVNQIIPFSATGKLGIDEVWSVIDQHTLPV